MTTDKQLIENLGGTSAVAKMLNTTPQRVCNWKKRGIPAHVKLANLNIFLDKDTINKMCN